MTLKAALLDAPAASGKGVFVRIDTLASEAELTDRHLPAIASCDLPAGRYVWIPGPGEAGGQFVEQAVMARVNRPDFDAAFIGLCAAVRAAGIELPPETVAWLEHAKKRGTRRSRRKEG
jgi:hypothetical protein